MAGGGSLRVIRRYLLVIPAYFWAPSLKNFIILKSCVQKAIARGLDLLNPGGVTSAHSIGNDGNYIHERRDFAL